MGPGFVSCTQVSDCDCFVVPPAWLVLSSHSQGFHRPTRYASQATYMIWLHPELPFQASTYHWACFQSNRTGHCGSPSCSWQPFQWSSSHIQLCCSLWPSGTSECWWDQIQNPPLLSYSKRDSESDIPWSPDHQPQRCCWRVLVQIKYSFPRPSSQFPIFPWWRWGV